MRFLSCEPLIGALPNLNLAGIHWVIVGGESGRRHRPIVPDWVRDIRQQRGSKQARRQRTGSTRTTSRSSNRLLPVRLISYNAMHRLFPS